MRGSIRVGQLGQRLNQFSPRAHHIESKLRCPFRQILPQPDFVPGPCLARRARSLGFGPGLPRLDHLAFGLGFHHRLSVSTGKGGRATSMMPSLDDQERIFVNKFVYRIESIQAR